MKDTIQKLNDVLGHLTEISFMKPETSEDLEKPLNDLSEAISEFENLDIPSVSHSRKTGKTLAMVMGIKATIEQGGKASVAGCKNPQPILDRLKALGIEAKAEPITATQPLKAIYETNGFQEYISGFTGDEKNQTGFIFYCA